jgi:hypothetical protein
MTKRPVPESRPRVVRYGLSHVQFPQHGPDSHPQVQVHPGFSQQQHPSFIGSSALRCLSF